jgi:hypothetical protein
MAKDEFGKHRSKSRFVLEIRYEPLIQAFDRRGALLEKLLQNFRKKMEHWRTENVAVHLADDFNSPSKQITVDHLRSLIIYEDPGSLEEFLNDSERFIRIVSEVFPGKLTRVKRIGVRFISVFELPGYGTYEDVFTKFMQTFFASQLPSSLRFKDCSIVLEHESGRIGAGPAKQDENWVKGIFSKSEENMPKFGFGIDIDSYAKEVECSSQENLVASFKTVFDLTVATENELIQALTKRS